MKEYLRSEFVRAVLRFLVSIVVAALVILVLSVIGLWVLLSTKGQSSLPNLAGPLAILLLLEGSLVGFAGALMFFGFSEYRFSLDRQDLIRRLPEIKSNDGKSSACLNKNGELPCYLQECYSSFSGLQ